jgi:L-glyceraldehyde 3-phosphate reductase
LKSTNITPEAVARSKRLNAIAEKRGQTLAEMSIAWNLQHKAVTSCLIGASRSSQIEDCVKALEKPSFSAVELKSIEKELAL